MFPFYTACVEDTVFIKKKYTEHMCNDVDKGYNLGSWSSNYSEIQALLGKML